VLEDVRKRGFFPKSVCWREPDGKYLAGISWNENVKVDFPMVCLPLDRLDELLLEHLQRDAEEWEKSGKGKIEVLFNHRAVAIDQDTFKARLQVEIGGRDEEKSTKWLTADYIVGADGANSGVRKILFGKDYPGETLQHQIIATNVYYDFHKFGYWDSNFIIDPDNWYMAAKITADGLWRVTYGDKFGLTNQEYLDRQEMRYEKILPGNPKPGDYKLVSKSPYKLQQRCAPSFRVGRVVLVADAAHLCNPFGGLGLTGGIADVGSLFDAFMAMQNGRADDQILDEYSRARIAKWKDFIDPTSR
jgi:2-polyprenyl-6-methoxyphenol hydroxylase-like FAD-dependent oxidoreductase